MQHSSACSYHCGTRYHTVDIILRTIPTCVPYHLLHYDRLYSTRKTCDNCLHFQLVCQLCIMSGRINTLSIVQLQQYLLYTEYCCTAARYTAAVAFTLLVQCHRPVLRDGSESLRRYVIYDTSMVKAIRPTLLCTRGNRESCRLRSL